MYHNTDDQYYRARGLGCSLNRNNYCSRLSFGMIQCTKFIDCDLSLTRFEVSCVVPTAQIKLTSDSWNFNMTLSQALVLLKDKEQGVKIQQGIATHTPGMLGWVKRHWIDFWSRGAIWSGELKRIISADVIHQGHDCKAIQPRRLGLLMLWE